MELDLAHDAHLKQLRLERTREQLAKFAGPATMYTRNIWQHFWEVFSEDSLLDKLGHGKITEYFEEINFNVKTFLSGEVNDMKSWLGPDLEEKCRQEPTCELQCITEKLPRVLCSKMPCI